MTTFINNKGIVQTRLRRNNREQKINELKWNANYDGKHAIVKVDVAKNGDKQKYRINLDNKDLAKLLATPSVNMPVDQRLRQDFMMQGPMMIQGPNSMMMQGPNSMMMKDDPLGALLMDQNQMRNYDIQPVLKIIPINNSRRRRRHSTMMQIRKLPYGHSKNKSNKNSNKKSKTTSTSASKRGKSGKKTRRNNSKSNKKPKSRYDSLF